MALGLGSHDCTIVFLKASYTCYYYYSEVDMAKSAAVLLAVLAFAAAPLLGYAAQPHAVKLNAGSGRTVELGGSMSMVAQQWFRVNGVEVPPGSLVRLVVHGVRDSGSIWIGSSGWVDIRLDNTSVYVNGSLVVDRGTVRINGEIRQGSVRSGLVLHVLPEPRGYLRLVIDGNTVVDYWDDGSDVVIRGLAPGSDGSMNLAFNLHYFEGSASEAAVNGQEVPTVTMGGVLVLALLSAALAARYGRR